MTSTDLFLSALLVFTVITVSLVLAWIWTIVTGIWRSVDEWMHYRSGNRSSWRRPSSLRTIVAILAFIALIPYASLIVTLMDYLWNLIWLK